MSGIALQRLQEERKLWRKNHPFGFYAKPVNHPDGTLNMFEWKVGIPGKPGTPWEGGIFSMKLTFTNDYPSKPPKVQFVPPIMHVNVFPQGHVCLSLINEDQDWKPSVTIPQILLGVQDLLNEPNPRSPANQEAYKLFTNKPAEYEARIRSQTLRFLASDM